MATDFKGKKYLVTGVGAGIGRGVAKELVNLGAEVWGVSRTKANLDSLQVRVALGWGRDSLGCMLWFIMGGVC